MNQYLYYFYLLPCLFNIGNLFDAKFSLLESHLFGVLLCKLPTALLLVSWSFLNLLFSYTIYSDYSSPSLEFPTSPTPISHRSTDSVSFQKKKCRPPRDVNWTLQHCIANYNNIRHKTHIKVGHGKSVGGKGPPFSIIPVYWILCSNYTCTWISHNLSTILCDFKITFVLLILSFIC